MIDELDRSLERWLRAAVPLPASAAEIGFEQPQKDWAARRSTPLLDLFLYALAPSERRAANGTRLVPRDGGGLARQREVPVIEARYLISVWGGGPGVEHDLLGRVVNLLAASRAIPDEHLSDALRAARPRPTISLVPDDSTTATQLWSALSVPPRPAFQLLIETPAGLPISTPANDPPSGMQLTIGDRRRVAARSQRRRTFGQADPAAAGGRAISRRGSAIIQDSGRYSVEADPNDPIVIEPPTEPGAGDA